MFGVQAGLPKTEGWPRGQSCHPRHSRPVPRPPAEGPQGVHRLAPCPPCARTSWVLQVLGPTCDSEWRPVLFARCESSWAQRGQAAGPGSQRPEPRTVRPLPLLKWARRRWPPRGALSSKPQTGFGRTRRTAAHQAGSPPGPWAPPGRDVTLPAPTEAGRSATWWPAARRRPAMTSPSRSPAARGDTRDAGARKGLSWSAPTFAREENGVRVPRTPWATHCLRAPAAPALYLIWPWGRGSPGVREACSRPGGEDTPPRQYGWRRPWGHGWHNGMCRSLQEPGGLSACPGALGREVLVRLAPTVGPLRELRGWVP